MAMTKYACDDSGNDISIMSRTILICDARIKVVFHVAGDVVATAVIVVIVVVVAVAVAAVGVALAITVAAAGGHRQQQP